MKTLSKIKVAAVFALALAAGCVVALAQSYSVDWYKISGGGGTSTGGTYQVTGTIGQSEAGSNVLSGGSYALTGGFWALIQVVQTPGAPKLYISQAGNTVTIYWQDVSGWHLVQGGNLATPIGSWANSGSPTLTGGTNYLSVTNPVGNVFFRLKNP